MHDQQLSCHMTNHNWRIAALVFVVIGGMYAAGLIFLFPDASEKGGTLVAWAVGGLAAVILLPLFASTARSQVLIGEPGLQMQQRTFFFLLSRKQSIAWSDVVAWDSGDAFLPLKSGAPAGITLYTVRRPLHLDATGKPFLVGNGAVTWDRFKERLESLLRSQGIPEATPEPAMTRHRNVRTVFVVVMALLGVLLVMATVLSVMQGQASYSLILAATLLFMLIARSGKWFFKK